MEIIKKLFKNLKKNIVNKEKLKTLIFQDKRELLSFETIHEENCNCFMCQKENAKINIHEDLKDGVLFEDGLHKMTMKVKTDKRKKIKGNLKDKKIIFENSLHSDDLEYQFLTNKLKENIIVKEKRAKYEYLFTFQLENLIFENNSFLDQETKEVIFQFGDLIMKDSQNKESTDIVLTKVSQKENEIVIKMEANADWLNDENRVFPIIIDPTIELVNQKTLNIVCYKGSSSVSPTNHKFEVGLLNAEQRMLLVLNVGNILTQVSDSQLSKMKCFIELHYESKERMRESPGFAFAKILGNDKVIYQEELLNEQEGKIIFDITSFIKDGKRTQSIYLQRINSDLKSSIEYYETNSIQESETKDYVTFFLEGSDESKAPKVILQLREEKCIEDSNSVKTFDSVRAGKTIVNIFNRQYRHIHEDATISNKNLSLTLNHVYSPKFISLGNQIYNKNKYLSEGWQTNLHQYLVKSDTYNEIKGGREITYIDGIGNEHEFLEKWYYEKDGKKTFINRNLVFVDGDQKLKTIVNNEFVEVKSLYESEEKDLSLFLSKDYNNFYGKEDINKTFRYFVTIADGYKIYLTFQDGKIKNAPYFQGTNNGTVSDLSYNDIIYNNGYHHKTSSNIVVKVYYQDKDLLLDEKGFYYTVVGPNWIVEKVYLKFDYTYNNFKDLENDEILLTDEILEINSQIKQLQDNINAFGKQMEVMNGNLNYYDFVESRKIIYGLDSIPDNELEDNKMKFNEDCDNYRKQFNIKDYENNIYQIKVNLEKLSLLKETKRTLMNEQKKEVNDLIFDKNGNILGFDGYGRLILIQNKKENKINVEYGYDEDNEGKMLSVYSDTEKIKFDYDKESGLLKDIIDSKGNKTGFEYLSNKLKKIIYSNGDMSLFESSNTSFSVENSLGHIWSLSSMNPNVITLTEQVKDYVIKNTEVLTNNSRTIDVVTMSKSSNDDTKSESDNNDTKSKFDNIVTITNSRKQTMTYQFDELGRVIEIRDDTGHAQYFKYEVDKLLFNIQSFEKNYIHQYSHIFSDSVTVTKDKIPTSNMMIVKCQVSDFIDSLVTTRFFLTVDVTSNGKTRRFVQEYQEISQQALIVPIFVDSRYDAIIGYSLTSNLEAADLIEEISQVGIYEASGEVYSYDNDEHLVKKESGLVYEIYEDFVFDKPTKITSGDGINPERISTRKYNANELVTYEEDYDGNITEYSYNEKNDLIKVKQYNKQDASLCNEQVYEYDDEGNLKEDSKESIYSSYDSNDYLIGLYSSAENKINSTTFNYNKGLLTCLKNSGIEINYNYDSLGRKTEIDICGEKFIENHYLDNITDSAYTNVDVVYSIKKDNNATKIIKDKLGNVLKTSYGLWNSNALNENEVIDFTYNEKNQCTSIAQKILNELKHSETYQYNKNNLYKKIVEGDSDLSIIYDRDYLNRVIKETITIDKNNNKKQVINYEYTDEYNSLINKVTLSNINQKINITYDCLNRIKEQSHFKNNKNLLLDKYEYFQKEENTTNLIKEHQIFVNDNLKDIVNYDYDENDNIVSISSDDSLIKYKYDELNRLIREDNEKTNKTTIFKYDTNGNILRKTIYGFTLDERPTNALTKELYNYASTGWKDRLVSIERTEGEIITKEVIEYNDLGYPVKYKGNNLTWTSKGELVSYGNTQYAYNYQGIRISKTNGNTQTTFNVDGNKIIAMKKPNEEIIFHYVLDKLVGFSYTNSSSTKKYIYQRNIQGDIETILDENGNVVGEYTYDAYGNCIITKDQDNIASKNPFRYRGYFFDVETNLYYLNSRYYDSKTGRFISPDILTILDETKTQINGLNLFMYCADNPVMFVDVSGFSWMFWLFAFMLLLVVPSLRSDVGPSHSESQIDVNDLNINGNNSNGTIEVHINNSGIKIIDSYRFLNEKDRIRILELIMNSETYKEYEKEYGYQRDLKSFLQEWNAHNTIYEIATIYGFLGIPYKYVTSTESVDLNWNPNDDKYHDIYKWF